MGNICDETDPQIVGITIHRHRREWRDDVRGGAGPDGQYRSGLRLPDALDITTGLDTHPKQQIGGPTSPVKDPINGFVFNHDCQRQRPGLLLQKGTVYLGYATYTCDVACPSDPYRGWIIGYRASDFAPAGVFTNSQSYPNGGMGVWASGNGLAGADDGSIFYQTGNDTGPSLAPLGDSFVKLVGDGTSLSLVLQYQPPNALSYKNGDTDLGSGGPCCCPMGCSSVVGKTVSFLSCRRAILRPRP